MAHTALRRLYSKPLSQAFERRADLRPTICQALTRVCVQTRASLASYGVQARCCSLLLALFALLALHVPAALCKWPRHACTGGARRPAGQR